MAMVLWNVVLVAWEWRWPWRGVWGPRFPHPVSDVEAWRASLRQFLRASTPRLIIFFAAHIHMQTVQLQERGHKSHTSRPTQVPEREPHQRDQGSN